MSDQNEQPANDSEPIEITISASITRNFGVETVQLGIERTVSITGREDRMIHYDTLYKVLDAQMNHYAQTFLKDVPQPGSQTRLGSGDFAVNTRVVPLERIVSEKKDSKVYYKAIGGEFKKFGVRVWDEVIKEAGLWEELEGNFSIEPKGFDMVIVMEGGKPRKVIKIVERKTE